MHFSWMIIVCSNVGSRVSCKCGGSLCKANNMYSSFEPEDAEGFNQLLPTRFGSLFFVFFFFFPPSLNVSPGLFPRQTREINLADL